MAPAHSSSTVENDHVGPHPSFIQIAQPYVFERTIRECMNAAGITEQKEDSIRLQGVAWIDSVRKALHLPMRTFNTACVYYHKFRLVHPDGQGYIDVAAAALFAACKIEDTLKKSREILCAAHNLKLAPAEQANLDDPIFEGHSKIIIGLERVMLESSGFDFRNRYPQELLVKIAKHYNVDKASVGKTAYNMSLDLYRTFAPLKQTTATMAIACVELSARIFEQNIPELEAGKSFAKWKTTRPEVMETLLDLLDLYTHHRASTVVGQGHAIETFISIRIVLNQEASAEKYPRFTETAKDRQLRKGSKVTNGVSKERKLQTSPRESSIKDVLSPGTGASTANGTTPQTKPGVREGTIRFMLDPERARDEKAAVAEYFKVEEEEYVEEFERGKR